MKKLLFIIVLAFQFCKSDPTEVNSTCSSVEYNGQCVLVLGPVMDYMDLTPGQKVSKEQMDTIMAATVVMLSEIDL